MKGNGRTSCDVLRCKAHVDGSLCACSQAMAAQGWWHLRAESRAISRTAVVCFAHGLQMRTSGARGALCIVPGAWRDDRPVVRHEVLERAEGCTQDRCLEVAQPQDGIGAELRLETVQLPGVALVARLCPLHARALLRGEPLTPTRWTEDLAAARAIASLLPTGQLGRGADAKISAGGGHVLGQQ